MLRALFHVSAKNLLWRHARRAFDDYHLFPEKEFCCFTKRWCNTTQLYFLWARPPLKREMTRPIRFYLLPHDSRESHEALRDPTLANQSIALLLCLETCPSQLLSLIRINSLHNRPFHTKGWCKFVMDVSLESLIKRTIDWLELICSRSWFSLSPAHVSNADNIDFYRANANFFLHLTSLRKSQRGLGLHVCSTCPCMEVKQL